MTTHEVPLPLPQPTPTTQPFWDAAREHRLVLPRDENDHVYFYPRALAPGTLAAPKDWIEASGKGIVYSFTVDRRGTAYAFRAKAPYVIAIIELEEGPHMTSNIVACEINDVHVGMPVQAVFEDQNDDITLVKFRPAAS